MQANLINGLEEVIHLNVQKISQGKIIYAKASFLLFRPVTLDAVPLDDFLCGLQFGPCLL